MSHTERECLAILLHLAKEGYSDLRTLSAQTHVSYANAQRYLRDEAWEFAPALSPKRHEGTRRERQEAWFAQQRRINPVLYWRFVQTLRPDPSTGLYKINRSKHDLLLHFAHLHHFELEPSPAYPGFSVSLPAHWNYNGERPEADGPMGVIATTR